MAARTLLLRRRNRPLSGVWAPEPPKPTVLAAAMPAGGDNADAARAGGNEDAAAGGRADGGGSVHVDPPRVDSILREHQQAGSSVDDYEVAVEVSLTWRCPPGMMIRSSGA